MPALLAAACHRLQARGLVLALIGRVSARRLMVADG